MKNLHFFGCSFTVGDELPLEELSKTMSISEYTEFRKNLSDNKEEEVLYIKKCKTMSFPALIEDTKHSTFNHAECGASLRTNIFHILKVIADPAQSIDTILLQIPPIVRELSVFKENNVKRIGSLQLLNPSDNVKVYAQEKLKKDYLIEELSINDLMDLSMLNSVLKEKNIKFYLINFFKELELRKKDITGFDTSFNFFNSMLPEDIIACQDIGGDENNKLVCRHFNKLAHQQIADRIKIHLGIHNDQL